MKRAIVGEFEEPEALAAAVRALIDLGYRDVDAYTPYPVMEVTRALKLGRSPLNWRVLPFALAGGIGAYLIQWWCNAYDYPINVGGRPLHSAPAMVPITFEMTVLFCGTAALVAAIVMSRLPELYHPIFEVSGFERASLDRFFVAVDARDPRYDPERSERELKDLGAVAVTFVRERT